MKIKAFSRRVLRLAGKVAARLRRIASQLTRPDETELLLEKMKDFPQVHGLSGKTVVITGSSRGVGLAVAREFARQGARVVLNGRNRSALDSAVAGIRAEGGNAVGVCADAASPEGAEKLVNEAVAAFGSIDVFVNNAATAGPVEKRVWEIGPQEIEEVLRTNLLGPFLCAAAAVGWMVRNGVKGRVINVSSGAAQAGNPGFSAYGVSKFGLEGLTQYLAADTGNSGIAVTSLMLGSLRTDMTRAAFPWEVHQALPPPETAVPAFVYVATAPSELVHGRVLAAWRLAKDAFAECMINGPLSEVPRLSFERLRYKGSPIERDSTEIAVMDRGENLYGASPAVEKAVRVAVEGSLLYQYPDFDYRRLRAALSRRLDLPGECFTFGNGSGELVERVLRVFVGPSEEVISNDPGWRVFERFCSMQGIVNRRVPFRVGGPSGRMSHNLKGVLDAIGHKTRLIYLINPSNPVGVGIEQDEFERFIGNVPTHIPVVIDEAYIEYADRPGLLRTHEVLSKTDRRVIGLRTFSKFYGLAGFRVGYGFAASDLVHLLDRLELPFNISTLSEVSAVAALEDDERNNFLRASIRKEHKRIGEACSRLGLEFIPSDSTMILIEIPVRVDRFYEAFEERGYFLPKGQYFDGKFTLFPVATPEQNERSLEVLESLMAGA
jgi:histidinol-phosphate aminotransferase